MLTHGPSTRGPGDSLRPRPERLHYPRNRRTARILKALDRKKENRMRAKTNVAEVERWASALSGAALTVLGVRQGIKDRPMGGAMLAAAGSTLIYRGATGHCPVYAVAGINRAIDDTRVALGGPRGINLEE